MTTEATGTADSQTQTTETTTADTAQTVQTPVVDTKLATTDTANTDTSSTPSTVSYEATGDAGLDVALAFVGKLGIASDHPAMLATATGDFGLIKAHLATMGDKAQGWEQMVALAEQAYERTEKARTETEAAVSKAVVAVAGSAENWAAIKDWASKNATPEEKQAINAMLDAGVVQARAAATMLVGAYNKASGTIVNPKSAVTNGTAGQTGDTNGPLTPRAYAAAVRELHGKLGNRMEQSQEYAALRARLPRRG